MVWNHRQCCPLASHDEPLQNNGAEIVSADHHYSTNPLLLNPRTPRLFLVMRTRGVGGPSNLYIGKNLKTGIFSI